MLGGPVASVVAPVVGGGVRGGPGVGGGAGRSGGDARVAPVASVVTSVVAPVVGPDLERRWPRLSARRTCWFRGRERGGPGRRAAVGVAAARVDLGGWLAGRVALVRGVLPGCFSSPAGRGWTAAAAPGDGLSPLPLRGRETGGYGAPEVPAPGGSGLPAGPTPPGGVNGPGTAGSGSGGNSWGGVQGGLGAALIALLTLVLLRLARLALPTRSGARTYRRCRQHKSFPSNRSVLCVRASSVRALNPPRKERHTSACVFEVRVRRARLEHPGRPGGGRDEGGPSPQLRRTSALRVVLLRSPWPAR